MSLRIPGYTWIGSWTSGNDYVNNGQQPKILLHMTVSTSLSMGYAQGHPYPPQSWANPYTGDKWQSIELDRAGMALYQPPYNLSWMNKNWYCSQTELVGYPEVNTVTYTEDQSKWIGENVIAPIWQAFQSVGVNVNLDNYRYHTDSSGSASEYWGNRMGDEEFFNFNGVLCHIDAFGNDHWDCSVERVDKWVAYAKQFLGQGGGGTPQPTRPKEDVMLVNSNSDGAVFVVDATGKRWIGPQEFGAWMAAGFTVHTMEEGDIQSIPNSPRAPIMRNGSTGGMFIVGSDGARGIGADEYNFWMNRQNPGLQNVHMTEHIPQAGGNRTHLIECRGALWWTDGISVIHVPSPEAVVQSQQLGQLDNWYDAISGNPMPQIVPEAWFDSLNRLDATKED